ncbi:MAG TPA: hypothetical protein VLJ58_21665 [Ramlibacter sp.]|nr:hypothetical protein [Ramlibacter sp.]
MQDPREPESCWAWIDDLMGEAAKAIVYAATVAVALAAVAALIFS